MTRTAKNSTMNIRDLIALEMTPGGTAVILDSDRDDDMVLFTCASFDDAVAAMRVIDATSGVQFD